MRQGFDFGRNTISLKDDLNDVLTDGLPSLTDDGDDAALQVYLNSKDFTRLVEKLVDRVKEHIDYMKENI